MDKPVSIFCCYSTEDGELYGQFESVLRTLEKEGVVRQWYARAVCTDTWRTGDLDPHLESADLIIPLVSPSLIWSGYCAGREVDRALARHDASEALVTPIIVRPCIWRQTALHRLEALPKHKEAVTIPSERGKAWQDVATAVRKATETPLLRPLYERLCERGRSALSTGQIEIAPYLDDLARDKRLGLTLIARPSEEVAAQLAAVNNLLSAKGPRHFYYAPARFHFTILSLVNAVDPPRVSMDVAARYVQPIGEVLSSFGEFQVEFSGVCATPSSLIARGFPVGSTLMKLRDALRRRLAEEGLADGLDERYQIQSAHVTLGRFRLNEDFSALVEILDQLRDIALGVTTVQRAQLVVNDFYMSPDKLRLVAECPMGVAISRCDENRFEETDEAVRTDTDVGESQTPKSECDVELGRTRSIGIVAALAEEHAAAIAMLHGARPYTHPGTGAGREYSIGDILGRDGSWHSVAVALVDQGANSAAARTTLLLQHFPRVDYVIMLGIAGGVPWPEKPADHVRLGDVVVSDSQGVIQYDFVGQTPAGTVRRFPPRPPSPELLEAARQVEAGAHLGRRPWERTIRDVCRVLRVRRPSPSTDILARADNRRKCIPHPEDPDRMRGSPRVFLGPIASANKLLKDPTFRDWLRTEYRVKAVEMEASGLAHATWLCNKGYLVVRGICDYCDQNKGDQWRKYAACAAAGYVRALLESTPGRYHCPPPPREVIHNLDRRPDLFVGRGVEQAKILRALSHNAKGTILTSGYAGIGKSTLAKMVAWTCVEHGGPFDLIAWVDARDYRTGQKISLSYVLDEVARASDSRSRMPQVADLDTKASRVRDLLASHRSLLILDNYEGLLGDPQEEQAVARFLESLPVGSADRVTDSFIRILVTTREVSQGLGALFAQELQLSRLPSQESLELMRSWSGEKAHLSDEECMSVWDALGGLPKYMVLATQLIKRIGFEQWEKMVDVRNIQVPPSADDPLFGDVFRESWQRMPADLKKILMSLTCFVADAPDEALRITSGLSETRFVKALVGDTGAYIERTDAGYTTHSLTHDFFRAALNSRAETAFRQQSGQRFVNYYLKRTRKATGHRGADLLEREIQNVVAAAHLAKRLQLWSELIELGKHVATPLRFRGYWREQVDILELVAEACSRLGEKQALAECLVHDLAWYHLRLEQLPEAERCARQGIRLFRGMEDRRGVAQGKRHLGKAALVSGLDPWYEPDSSWKSRSRVAQRCYEDSLALRLAVAEEGLDQRSQIGDIKLDFGRLYWLDGKWYAQEGRKKGDSALANRALERFAQACDVSWEAMGIFRGLDNRRGMAKAWGNLGNPTKEIAMSMLAVGRLSEAREYLSETHEYYQNSLDIAQSIGRTDEIAHAQWGLAEVYELYADHSALHGGFGNADALLATALEYARASQGAYVFLGGGRDIRATDRLVRRIGDKLTPRFHSV